ANEGASLKALRLDEGDAVVYELHRAEVAFGHGSIAAACGEDVELVLVAPGEAAHRHPAIPALRCGVDAARRGAEASYCTLAALNGSEKTCHSMSPPPRG